MFELPLLPPVQCEPLAHVVGCTCMPASAGGGAPASTVPHVPAGNTAKLVVDQGRQAIERRLVAAAPGADEGGNLD